MSDEGLHHGNIGDVSRDVGRIWQHVFGNGRPGLETRMCSHVEEVRKGIMLELEKMKRHGNANMEEGDQGVMHELAHETQARESQHEENKKTLAALTKQSDRLERVFYVACGVFMVLKFFGVDNILKMVTK